MSIVYEMMMRDHTVTKALRKKYPGVLFNQKIHHFHLNDKERILNQGKENWPDNISKLVNNIEQNAELSKMINMNLDWFYEPEEAEKYLSEPEVFKNSFAVLKEEKHSVEYILYHLMECNYEVEECFKTENGVVLRCFFKEHDYSDKWNPGVRLRETYIFLKCDKPETVFSLINKKLENSEHHYGTFSYADDVETITEMTEEEINTFKKEMNKQK